MKDLLHFMAPNPLLLSTAKHSDMWLFGSSHRRGRTYFPISLNLGWPCDFLGLKECHGNDDVPVLSLSLKEPCPRVLLVSLLQP